MNAPLIYWRAPKHASMAWYSWSGEYVFHHLLSNDTHQLSGRGGKVMRCLLEQGELDTHALVDCSGLTLEELGPILQTLADIDFVTWR